EDGIRDDLVTGVQTCALPICRLWRPPSPRFARRRESGRKERPAMPAPKFKPLVTDTVGLALAHDSAALHTRGAAQYVDDMREPRSEERRVGKACECQRGRRTE